MPIWMLIAHDPYAYLTMQMEKAQRVGFDLKNLIEGQIHFYSTKACGLSDNDRLTVLTNLRSILTVC